MIFKSCQFVYVDMWYHLSQQAVSKAKAVKIAIPPGIIFHHMLVLLLIGSNVIEDGNGSTPSDLIWHSLITFVLQPILCAVLVTRDFLKVQQKKPYGNILISRGREMCSRSPPSGIHNGSDAPSSNKNNGKKLAIGYILGISLGSLFFISLIDLVLILFCHKRKWDEHVIRPSTVNPPFSSEKGESPPDDCWLSLRGHNLHFYFVNMSFSQIQETFYRLNVEQVVCNASATMAVIHHFVYHPALMDDGNEKPKTVAVGYHF
ncbi:protein STRUBBELIG-receptor family 8 [Tanacetum coccineum]